MTARLIALAGPLCGEAFSLNGPETTIGRDPAADLSIPDHLMSRRHCVLESAGGRVSLRDLGSSNGTFVNGDPARERLLEHGDRIHAGESILLYLQSDAPRAAAAPDAPEQMDDVTVRMAGHAGGRPYAPPLQMPDGTVGEILPAQAGLRAHEMVGDSPAMRTLYDRIRKAAPANSTVLICGETGTGKELAARAIHQNSPRAGGPFVAVNCAALTESLLESELFGHERGAFTGAVSQKPGKLEIAHRGTLFLDEIAELAPALQAKLLRSLQSREFERVGGTRTIKVDVRVIAATNRDLAEEVKAGRFRHDLWYRLNVVSLLMPPLRSRRADIPLLAAHFAAKYGGGRPMELSREAVAALSRYDWPGNVRELENAIESAVVMGGSTVIVAGDLPETVLGGETASPERTAYHRSMVDTKRRLILDAIDRSGGNYTAAARLLGINPTYLHRLVRNLQLRDATARR